MNVEMRRLLKLQRQQLKIEADVRSPESLEVLTGETR